jgi:multidrug efflux system membrane fusion protein
MDLERYKQAWAKNAIPRQTFEDQEKVVLQIKGTVKNDEGTVEYDKVQVGYCHITSPITGRVGLRLADPGNLVTANSTTTLVVVTEIQPITVVFTLAEDALPQVLQQTRGKQQLKVEALDRAQQGHLATGKLTSIDNQIDTTTGTVKLRAEFDNHDGALFPNQFVNTRLLVKTLESQTLIPSSAIQHNGSQDFVYVIQDNKATVRTVKVGNSDKGETAVQGINPGDIVADSSFEKLQNGSQTTISKIKLPSTSSDTTGSPAQ